MLTLAVDTTAEFGSLALAENEEILEEVLLHHPEGFSGVIFAQIEALLARQNVGLNDIELFAGASGPGSFTGVRIGLAAMKGLGETLGRPVAAISNLEALAQFGSADYRAAVIDARRGEVFAAVFNRAGETVIPEQVTPFPRFLEQLHALEHDFGQHLEWVSSHFDPFESLVTEPIVRAPRALAGVIARLAARRPLTDPAVIEANYVRRSDAELLWKK